MVIDLPQVVDIVANPAGVEFLAATSATSAGWFHSPGSR